MTDSATATTDQASTQQHSTNKISNSNNNNNSIGAPFNWDILSQKELGEILTFIGKNGAEESLESLGKEELQNLFKDHPKWASYVTGLTGRDLKQKLTTLQKRFQGENDNNGAPAAGATITSSSSSSSASTPSPGEHPLEGGYTLSFTHRAPGKIQDDKSYTDKIQTVGSFHTVEKFWSLYSYCKRPDALTPITDINIFREGIKPLWEDENNAHGGRWVLNLKKGISARIWENLIFALIGEKLEQRADICGIVLSVKEHEDHIAIWTKHPSQDAPGSIKIRDSLKRVLGVNNPTILRFRPHKYYTNKPTASTTTGEKASAISASTTEGNEDKKAVTATGTDSNAASEDSTSATK